MKQFIVLLAALPLMMFILIQMSMDQITAYKINGINNCVYEAKDKAQIEGCFTAEIRDELEIGFEKLGFSAENIHLSLDQTPVDRGEYIHYAISVDFGPVMLTALAGENNYTYTIDSYAVSEKYIE